MVNIKNNTSLLVITFKIENRLIIERQVTVSCSEPSSRVLSSCEQSSDLNLGSYIMCARRVAPQKNRYTVLFSLARLELSGVKISVLPR